MSKVERPIENWTKFPNCILDNLDKLTGNEIKILCLMVRKNLGWNNPNRQFSLSYLQSKLNMARATVVKSLKELLVKESIIALKSKDATNRYKINWTVPKIVHNMNQFNNCTSTSSKNELSLVQKLNTVKETISNRTLYKETKTSNKNNDFYCFSEYLLNQIKSRDSKYNYNKDDNRIIELWANSFRLLHEKDGRELTDIWDVLKWSQDNDFWCNNILSGSKLRKQYTKLLLAMQKDKGFTNKTHDSQPLNLVTNIKLEYAE